MPAIFEYALLTIPFIGAYAMFALGISVIYRASRVLNLAHGAMAMLPAYIAYSLSQAGVPMLFVLVLAVASGAILGVVVERLFVHRLRAQGPTAQTVGTVAVTGLLIALAAKIWGSQPLLAPQVFPTGTIPIGDSGVRSGELGLFLTAVVVSIAMFAFFRYTDYGLAMRGAAQNRRAAALMGIDPDRAAMAAWALGGGLAALAGVMLAAVTNLDPYLLSLQVVPAFVAALIGGLESLPGALWGSAIAGLSYGIVPYFSGTPGIGRIVRYAGAQQLALAVLAVIVMGLRGRRFSGAESSQGGLTGTIRPFRPLRSRSMRWWVLGGALFIGLWPLIVPFSVVTSSLNWIELTLAALSLVVLTGWVGQISLAQASFVGIAALFTGLVTRGWSLGYPESTVVAALAAAAAAMLLGVVALRVRGLYLAVATLIFAWMCDAFLFNTPWLGVRGGSSTIEPQRIGDPAGLPYFDLTKPRTLFWVVAPLLALVMFCLANMRDTKTGRAFFAVRGSEMAAASLGINVVRTKLVAFAIAGAVAGVAGNVLMLDLRSVGPGQFFLTISLQYLAIAVVGGLGSIGGAVGAAALFASLDELFLRVQALTGWLDVVSAGLLAVVLLAYPGGLAAISHKLGAWLGRIRAARAARAARREPAGEAAPVSPPTAQVAVAGRHPARNLLGGAWKRTLATVRPLNARVRTAGERLARLREKPRPEGVDWLAEEIVEPTGSAVSAIGNGHGGAAERVFSAGPQIPVGADSGSERPVVVRAEAVTVRFGGLVAVNDASLAVHRGTVTGLIGPNGAGKTTLFNAILGLNEPSAGRIMVFDRDVTAEPPHVRAGLGVARTFQVLQLFSELTVFDNLLVATHLHNHSGLASNLVASSRTLAAETAARRRVRRVLRMLEIEDIAQHGVRGLPFGTLRMVELGRALVTGARLIMLDEPASGLNEAETDRLSAVIGGLREIGLSVLLIEHDVRMVTGVCDHVYVLDQGQMIAEGTPAEIQRDQRVVAAYLGSPAELERAPVGV